MTDKEMLQTKIHVLEFSKIFFVQILLEKNICTGKLSKPSRLK